MYYKSFTATIRVKKKKNLEDSGVPKEWFYSKAVVIRLSKQNTKAEGCLQPFRRAVFDEGMGGGVAGE